MSFIDKFRDLPILALSILYIVLAPYTKVEESFNVQATHDLLYFGTNIENYDHLEFPGVVPRTFIGSILLSILSYPYVFMINYLKLSKFYSLIVVRSCLAFLNYLSLRSLRRVLETKYQKTAGNCFIFLTCLQFHLLFYMSRLLPNTFALILTNFGWSFYLECKYKSFVYCFTFAAIVFRCDVLVLLAPLGVYMLLTNKITLKNAVLIGGSTLLFGCFLSYIVDSYFWRYPLIPELSVLYYNTILNKSSNWGTQPYLWYFYSALPRSLFSSLCYIPFAVYPQLSQLFCYPFEIIQSFWKSSETPSFLSHIYKFFWSLFVVDSQIKDLLIPIFTYLLLYSILPHKELRFIFPILPLFTYIAALGFSRLWSYRSKSKRIWIIIFIYTFISLLYLIFMLYISAHNYPGGSALMHFYELPKTLSHSVPIYIDTYSAETGISRYLEDNLHYLYNKTENLSSLSSFKYILTHNVTMEFFESMNLTHVDYIFNQTCFSGISKSGIKFSDCVYILDNLDFF